MHWLQFLFCSSTCLAWLMNYLIVDGCYHSINSKGVTEPLGDINKKIGQNLSITCTITDDSVELPDSSSIIWMLHANSSTSVVPRKQVTIIDRKSARLDISNLSSSHSGNYLCMINSTQDNLCNNMLFVGTLPKKITDQDFSCLSQQWKNMTCKWKATPTGLFTNWTLQMRIGKNGSGRQRCPKYLKSSKGENNACVYSSTVSPGYDLIKESFVFLLMGKNALGSISSEFVVDHFSRVIAAAPVGLTVDRYGSNGFKISWELDKEFRHFPRDLVYRLEYQSQWDHPETWKHVMVGNEKKYILLGLTPFSKYKITLRCRSEPAPDIEMMWSEPVSRLETTAPAVPKDSVHTIFSGFEDVKMNPERRNITIYWQPLPSSQYFGPNFHYAIDAVDNHVIVESKIRNGTEFQATFQSLHNNRNYKFVIRSGNSEGYSTTASEIHVPQIINKAGIPESFSVTAIKAGVFQLSWKSGSSRPSASSSVFWCKAAHTHRNPCQEPLAWKTVHSNETGLAIVMVDESSKNYRFAVSSDDSPNSSGLLWSKCIATYSGVIGQVQMMSITSLGSDRIRVTWQMDCAERIGILEGFYIQYCLYGSEADECLGKENAITVNGSDVSSYIINGLKPFATYRVTLAAKTRDHIGEACDPQFIMTDQDAPSDPPTNSRVQSVTNRSIHVMWNGPEEPNGNLTHFLLTYNDNLAVINISTFKSNDILEEYSTPDDKSVYSFNITENVHGYTNYSIHLRACTSNGCSPSSKEIVAATDIGVPGIPEEPKVSLINQSHALIEWHPPREQNGPVGDWCLLIRRSEGGSNYSEQIYPPTSPHIIPIHCNTEAVEYSIAIRAINRKNGQSLVGAWSKAVTLNACFYSNTSLFSLHMTFLAIGLFLLATLLLIFLRHKLRSFWQKIREMRTVKIDLPNGLIAKDLHYEFKKNPTSLPIKKNEDQYTNARFYGRLQSISSDEGRCSMESDDISIDHNTLSVDSVNYEKFLDRDCNLSQDGRYCHSGDGSVSSTFTNHTHLSSDSGATNYGPSSPDSVFMDCPWITHSDVSLPSNSRSNSRSHRPESVLGPKGQRQDAIMEYECAPSGDHERVESNNGPRDVKAEDCENCYCKITLNDDLMERFLDNNIFVSNDWNEDADNSKYDTFYFERENVIDTEATNRKQFDDNISHQTYIDVNTLANKSNKLNIFVKDTSIGYSKMSLSKYLPSETNGSPGNQSDSFTRSERQLSTSKLTLGAVATPDGGSALDLAGSGERESTRPDGKAGPLQKLPIVNWSSRNIPKISISNFNNELLSELLMVISKSNLDRVISNNLDYNLVGNMLKKQAWQICLVCRDKNPSKYNVTIREMKENEKCKRQLQNWR